MPQPRKSFSHLTYKLSLYRRKKVRKKKGRKKAKRKKKKKGKKETKQSLTNKPAVKLSVTQMKMPNIYIKPN